MRANLDIPFGGTGALVYYDALEGRASSVTSMEIRAWNAGDDETAESALGSAAVETNPNTTLDGAAGLGQSDPRSIPLAATTGIVIGRHYLLTAADGNREWVEPIEIDSGNLIIARHPLRNAYASADTFQSTRIAATIDSTWIADDGNITADSPSPGYRCRVVYTVAGVVYRREFNLDVVRVAGTHGVTGLDVDNMIPGWLKRLPVDHQRDQGKRIIDEAYVDVEADLAEVWRAGHQIADAAVVDTLVRYKTIELGEFARLLAGGSVSDGGVRDRYDIASSRYVSRLKSLIRVPDKVPQRTSTGAAEVRRYPGVVRS